VTRIAQDERRALCDLFLQVGPHAPTLCEGWTTSDLAAHLVVRDRRPDAAAGAVFPPLARYAERVRIQIRDRQRWEDLVERVRRGPPAALRIVDEPINTVEYFVHHEDVRRAAPGWDPRPLDPALEEALWSRLRRMGRLLVRKAPTAVSLDAPRYGRATVKRGSLVVTVRGAPSELTLLAFGRAPEVRVDYQGDEVSVERFRHARLGF
jgi:uncharacterized protein (TIGR03085 family)